jgi:two-component system response regulator YesN
MEAAKALLAAGELRVSDVAERVGVHDVKYFSRLFKKVVGMTPGEYRLKAQK